MKNITSTPTYTVLKPEKKIPPTILFTPKALKWIEALIENHSEEVGFYGIVEEDNYKFLITDIFYPKHQLATATTCEISPEGEADIMNWLINHNRAEDISKMMMWGHSHHSMGISPSAQDDKQAVDRMESTKHHIIRVIVNKEKLMSVSFFDYNQQVRFDNIAWKEFDNTGDSEKIKLLNDIQAVLSSNSDPDKKILDIDRIMYSDHEMQEINKKVIELKEINIPKPVVHSYHNGVHTSYGAGYTPLSSERFPRLSNLPIGSQSVVQTNVFENANNQPEPGEDEDEMFPFTGHGSSAEEVRQLMEGWGE